MFGHDPWKRYRLHPDHRNAGWLVTDGIVAARDPLFFPELDSPPHRPSTLLLFEPDEVDHVEDVSGYAEAKIGALLEHKSQHRSTMGIESDPSGSAESSDVAEFKAHVAERLATNGQLAGLAAGEVFHRIGHI
jgi:LmbE family N-acetylglucosaminyl deacetylase